MIHGTHTHTHTHTHIAQKRSSNYVRKDKHDIKEFKVKLIYT